MLGAISILAALSRYGFTIERNSLPDMNAEKGSTEWWIAAFTGMLFLATLGLMIATLGLWSLGFRQSEDMRHAIAIFKQSADAAKQSAEIASQSFTKIERPYVFPSNVSRLLPPTEKIGQIHIEFTLSNFGRTPALVNDLSAELFVLPSPSNQPVLFSDKSKHKMGEILAGGDQIRDIVCFMSIEDARHLSKIHERDLYLMFIAAVFYNDIFGQKHYALFRWLYHPDKDYFASYGGVEGNTYT